MRAEELRVDLIRWLEDEYDESVKLQGKRIVFGEGDETVIVLVTRGRTEREREIDALNQRTGLLAARAGRERVAREP